MKNLRIKTVAVGSAIFTGVLCHADVYATDLYNGAPGTLTTNQNLIVNLSSTLATGTVINFSITGYIINPTLTSGAVRLNTATNISGSYVGAGIFNFSTTSSTQTGQVTSTGSVASIGLGLSGNYGGGSPTSWVISNLYIYTGSSSAPSVDLAPNAYALRSVYNMQSVALNAGLSYDCNVFDKEGLCLSTGGRYSTTNSPQATTTSGLLIGSYKYDKNVRVGAWVDQNLSTQNADGIKLSNNAPLFGVFGVWAERNDGLGYEVKVSAGYGDKDVTVTRTSTNEGSSKVNSRGLQTVSSYGIALDSNWIAAPYVGMKYVSLKRGGYTEGGSSALTYDNLRQESTSVIAGVKFTGKIDPKTFTVLSAGVEQDLNNNVGQYSAGSSNTTAFNSNVQKTRPVVSAGVFYDIDKTQRVGLNAMHRQEAFQSTASTTALATYTVGF